MTPTARAVLEDVAIEQGRHEAFMRRWQVDWGFDVGAEDGVFQFAIAFSDAVAPAHTDIRAEAYSYVDAAVADAVAYANTTAYDDAETEP